MEVDYLEMASEIEEKLKHVTDQELVSLMERLTSIGSMLHDEQIRIDKLWKEMASGVRL